LKPAFETAESYRKLIEAQRTLTVMLESNAPTETINYQKDTIKALKVAWDGEGRQRRRADAEDQPRLEAD